MTDILRKKTGLERLEIVFGMWECAQEMIQYKVEDEHPDWSKAERRKEVACRMASGGIHEANKKPGSRGIPGGQREYPATSGGD